ncbi:sulfurtransferase [Paenibacillus sp. NPDC058177]|uniref:sulfurtransferase n=1 Tax=Paenibacillus sp. NPDC058177 TaxID=3346369 RepID=UPI0036D99985
MSQWNSIVSVEWLKANMQDPNVVIVDCRFVMGDAEAGRQAYESSHIAGAVYLDLEKDLSGPIEEHGGRHPLPDPATLAHRLSQVGISNASKVFAYDSQGGMMASRLWWLLRYLGHEQAAILDGGWSAWLEAGYPVTAEQTNIVDGTFLAVVDHAILAEVYHVQNAIQNESVVIIDSRENPRYLGEIEPLDKAAGHIPGAKNHFWKDSLNGQGLFKRTEEQAERFADLKEYKEIIVYCGSGVSATPNVLALNEAGFTNVKLYAGSWSDWISYEENPVATGEEK